MGKRSPFTVSDDTAVSDILEVCRAFSLHRSLLNLQSCVLSATRAHSSHWYPQMWKKPLCAYFSLWCICAAGITRCSNVDLNLFLVWTFKYSNRQSWDITRFCSIKLNQSDQKINTTQKWQSPSLWKMYLRLILSFFAWPVSPPLPPPPRNLKQTAVTLLLLMFLDALSHSGCILPIATYIPSMGRALSCALNQFVSGLMFIKTR